MGGDKPELRYALDEYQCDSFRNTLNECAKRAAVLRHYMDETGLTLEDL